MGLESAWRHGLVNSESEFRSFIDAALSQFGHGQLPFVMAVRNEPEQFFEMDRLLDATLSNHVANAASRTQGRSLLRAAREVYESTELSELATNVTESNAAAHMATCFGYVAAVIDLDVEVTARLTVFLTLRDLVSSAVRLGVGGRVRGQVFQREANPRAEEVAALCARIPVDEATQTAPLLEILQTRHDTLYSRLFRS